jgi:hypothetical protein
MIERVKDLAGALVVALLLTLVGQLFPPSRLLLPGYLLARLVLPLPEPYLVGGSASPPYIEAVLVANVFFWLTLAFVVILGRSRRSNSVRRPENPVA